MTAYNTTLLIKKIIENHKENDFQETSSIEQ